MPVIDVEIIGQNPTILGSTTPPTIKVTIVSLGAFEEVFAVGFYWGDGNSDTQFLTLDAGQFATSTPIYAAPGTYQPHVLVFYTFHGGGSFNVDQVPNNGEPAPFGTPIVVYPHNPSIVDFSVSPIAGTAPLMVTAHLTPSLWAAPLVNAVIVWGPTDADNTSIDLSTWTSGEVQATHTYTVPAIYTVEARVNYAAVAGIDNFGREVISDVTVTVTSLPAPDLTGSQGGVNAYFSRGRR